MADLCCDCGVWPEDGEDGRCSTCREDCGCDAVVLDSGHCDGCGRLIEGPEQAETPEAVGGVCERGYDDMQAGIEACPLRPGCGCETPETDDA